MADKIDLYGVEDPYNLFRDEDWRTKTPLMKQFMTFEQISSKDPEWQQADAQTKLAVLNKHFGTNEHKITRPTDILKHPDFINADENTQINVFNAVVSKHPDWAQMSPDARRATRAEFFEKNVKPKVAEQKQREFEFAEGLKAQRAAEKERQEYEKIAASAPYAGGVAAAQVLQKAFKPMMGKSREELQAMGEGYAEDQVLQGMAPYTIFAATLAKRMGIAPDLDTPGFREFARGNITTVPQTLSTLGVGAASDVAAAGDLYLPLTQKLLAKAGIETKNETWDKVADALDEFAQKTAPMTARLANQSMGMAADAVLGKPETKAGAQIMRDMDFTKGDIKNVGQFVDYVTRSAQQVAASAGPTGVVALIPGAGQVLAPMLAHAFVVGEMQMELEEKAGRGMKPIEASIRNVPSAALELVGAKAIFKGFSPGVRAAASKWLLNRAVILSEGMGKESTTELLQQFALMLNRKEQMGESLNPLTWNRGDWNELAETFIQTALGTMLFGAGGASTTQTAREAGYSEERARRRAEERAKVAAQQASAQVAPARIPGEPAAPVLQLAPPPQQVSTTPGQRIDVEAAPGPVPWPSTLDATTKAELEALPENAQKAVWAEATSRLNSKGNAFLEEYGLDHAGEIPKQELDRMGLEAINETYSALKAAMKYDPKAAEKAAAAKKEEAAKAKESKAAEKAAKTSAAEAELKVAEWVDYVGTAQNLDQLDEIETKWKASTRAESKHVKKSVAAKRKELSAPKRAYPNEGPVADVPDGYEVEYFDDRGFSHGGILTRIDGKPFIVENGIPYEIPGDANVGNALATKPSEAPKKTPQKRGPRPIPKSKLYDDVGESIHSYALENGNPQSAAELTSYLDVDEAEAQRQLESQKIAGRTPSQWVADFEANNPDVNITAAKLFKFMRDNTNLPKGAKLDKYLADDVLYFAENFPGQTTEPTMVEQEEEVEAAAAPPPTKPSSAAPTGGTTPTTPSTTTPPTTPPKPAAAAAAPYEGEDRRREGRTYRDVLYEGSEYYLGKDQPAARRIFSETGSSELAVRLLEDEFGDPIDMTNLQRQQLIDGLNRLKATIDEENPERQAAAQAALSKEREAAKAAEATTPETAPTLNAKEAKSKMRAAQTIDELEDVFQAYIAGRDAKGMDVQAAVESVYLKRTSELLGKDVANDDLIADLPDPLPTEQERQAARAAFDGIVEEARNISDRMRGLNNRAARVHFKIRLAEILRPGLRPGGSYAQDMALAKDWSATADKWEGALKRAYEAGSQAGMEPGEIADILDAIPDFNVRRGELDEGALRPPGRAGRRVQELGPERAAPSPQARDAWARIDGHLKVIRGLHEKLRGSRDEMENMGEARRIETAEERGALIDEWHDEIDRQAREILAILNSELDDVSSDTYRAELNKAVYPDDLFLATEEEDIWAEPSAEETRDLTFEEVEAYQRRDRPPIFTPGWREKKFPSTRKGPSPPPAGKVPGTPIAPTKTEEPTDGVQEAEAEVTTDVTKKPEPAKKAAPKGLGLARADVIRQQIKDLATVRGAANKPVSELTIEELSLLRDTLEELGVNKDPEFEAKRQRKLAELEAAIRQLYEDSVDVEETTETTAPPKPAAKKKPEPAKRPAPKPAGEPTGKVEDGGRQRKPAKKKATKTGPSPERYNLTSKLETVIGQLEELGEAAEDLNVMGEQTPAEEFKEGEVTLPPDAEAALQKAANDAQAEHGLTDEQKQKSIDTVRRQIATQLASEAAKTTAKPVTKKAAAAKKKGAKAFDSRTGPEIKAQMHEALTKEELEAAYRPYAEAVKAKTREKASGVDALYDQLSKDPEIGFASEGKRGPEAERKLRAEDVTKEKLLAALVKAKSFIELDAVRSMYDRAVKSKLRKPIQKFETEYAANRKRVAKIEDEAGRLTAEQQETESILDDRDAADPIRAEFLDKILPEGQTPWHPTERGRYAQRAPSDIVSEMMDRWFEITGLSGNVDISFVEQSIQEAMRDFRQKPDAEKIRERVNEIADKKGYTDEQRTILFENMLKEAGKTQKGTPTDTEAFRALLAEAINDGIPIDYSQSATRFMRDELGGATTIPPDKVAAYNVWRARELKQPTEYAGEYQTENKTQRAPEYINEMAAEIRKNLLAAPTKEETEAQAAERAKQDAATQEMLDEIDRLYKEEHPEADQVTIAKGEEQVLADEIGLDLQPDIDEIDWANASQEDIAKLIDDHRDDVLDQAVGLEQVSDTGEVIEAEERQEEMTEEEDEWKYQRGYVRFGKKPHPSNVRRQVAQLDADLKKASDETGPPPSELNSWIRNWNRFTHWISTNFSSTRKMPERAYELWLELQGQKSAGTSVARATRADVQAVVNRLAVTNKRPKVLGAVSLVFEGRITNAEFQKMFSLSDDDPIMTFLDQVREHRDMLRTRLASIPGLPEGLRNTILTNDHYMTQFYAVHMLGEGFNVQAKTWLDARNQVIGHLQESLDSILAKAEGQIGKTDTFPLADFMAADAATRATMVQGLSKTKAQNMIRLGQSLDPFMHLIQELEIKPGGKIEAKKMTDALIAEADRYLMDTMDSARNKKNNRVLGPLANIPVSNQLQRTLDETFRKLFGQVENPVERIARTIEVQERLLAHAVFFEKMRIEGENRWWSQRRNEEDGFVTRLVMNPAEGVTIADRRRYGGLAGAYVTQELYDFLHNTGPFKQLGAGEGKIVNSFLDLQARLRAIRLVWPKTMLRNAISAAIGFGLRSGDATHHQWWEYWLEGNKMVLKLAKSELGKDDAEALRFLADLQAKGVFDLNQESMLQFITERIERDNRLRPDRKHLASLMRFYSLIDLPAKYAAYMLQREVLKKGEQESVQHVRDFYQFKYYNPEIVQKINRLPLADYFGYTVDSTRIWKNATINAVKSAAKGEWRPLFGYIMSATIPAADIGAGVWTASLTPRMTAAVAHTMGNWIAALPGGRDPDDDEEYRPATNEEVTALRSTLPSYDRWQNLAVWYTRNPGGKWELHYKVIANVSFSPLEEAVLGAVQSTVNSQSGKGFETFTTALLTNLGEITPFSISMATETLGDLLGVGGKPGDAGVLQIANSLEFRKTVDDPLVSVRPDAAHKLYGGVDVASIKADWRDALLRFTRSKTGEFLQDVAMPGQSGRQLVETLESLKYQEMRPGSFKQTKTPAEVTLKAISLTRSYSFTEEEQLGRLRSMTGQAIENLRIAKTMASTAEREASKYKSGEASPLDVMMSEDGRRAWASNLQMLERQVKNFKTLFPDWDDDSIANALSEVGPGLKKSEAQAIATGAVSKLKAENFESEAQASRYEKGEHVVKAMLRKGAIDPAAVRKQLDEAGYRYPGSQEENGAIGAEKYTKWIRRLNKEVRSGG